MFKNGNLTKILLAGAIALLGFMGTNIRINTSAIHKIDKDVGKIQVSQEAMKEDVSEIKHSVEKIADRI